MSDSSWGGDEEDDLLQKEEKEEEMDETDENTSRQKEIQALKEQQQKLVDDLKVLFNKEEYSDVKILVGNVSKGEKLKPCYGHRPILASRCPFMKSMFFYGWKESSMKEIEIPNVNYDVFLTFMQFLYTGHVVINKDNVMALLPCADEFNVVNLRRACLDYLVKNINNDTVIKILLEAQDGTYRFNCDDLISRCLKFIEKHTGDVVKSPQFFLFEERILIEMTENPMLHISEIELFKAIIRWGNYRRRDLTCTTPLKEIVKNLVPNVRYPLISGPDLVNIVKPCQVVPEDLYIAALEYVNAPDVGDHVGVQYVERGSEEALSFVWSFEPNLFSYPDPKEKKTILKSGIGGWVHSFAFGSTTFTSGIHYWEIKINHSTDTSGIFYGVTPNKSKSYYTNDIVVGCNGGKHNCQGNDIYCSSGDVVGCKLDFKKGVITFYREGYPTGTSGYLVTGQSYTPVIHVRNQNDKFTLQFPKKIP